MVIKLEHAQEECSLDMVCNVECMCPAEKLKHLRMRSWSSGGGEGQSN